MCGIFASLGLDAPRAAVERAAHRGPDGSGWVALASAAGPVCLGHRRLTITSAGEAGQPVSDAHGGWLTYNGEIYYRDALRADLERGGQRVEGTSDTALVLAALRLWGEGALARLEGMFAFVYYDARTGRLLAARDRFGIKPLYCWQSEAGVAFASEIQQFLALPGFRARLDEARARDFLELGLTDHTPQTLWRGVASVPAGAFVRAQRDVDGRCRLTQQSWYRLPESASRSSGEAVERFAAALRRSVAAHVPERVGVGVSLSGGLDSSAVACLTPQPLPCLALAHDEPDIDESRYARSVTERTGSALTLVRLPADELPAALAAAVRSLDEPFPSLSVVAQWAVFREARRLGLKVLLTGQGADELLGGYPFLLGVQLAALLRAGRFVRLGRELRAQRALHGRGAVAAARSLATAVLPAAWLPRLVRRGGGEPLLARARLAVARGGRSDAARLGLGAFRHDLLGAANLAMVLRYEDRTAMAHGIEARPPFLDRAVVESALAIAGDDLIEAGITKQPLRAALRDVLPEPVLARTDKRGFPTPEAAWLKGPLAGFVLTSARTAHARFPALVGEREVARIAAALAEPGPLRAPVWRVGALGAWAEAFGVET